MEKSFNITGLCLPDQHYMADVSKKLNLTLKMVQKGNYFAINRPRQYGKTTLLNNLTTALRAEGNYIVFKISFEGVGDLMFEDEKVFSQEFVGILANYAQVASKDLVDFLKSKIKETYNLRTLSDTISELVNQTDKRVVLMIDEVDKSSSNQLFVSFLAMLRDKYLSRNELKTFHSVVLAGLHDVKTLKLKLRPDEERKFNSPWNIAADYKVDMNLQVAEIKPMLEDYCSDRGIEMDTDAIAERLFYYTSGYPFLVSKFCKTIDEEILPEKNTPTWTLDDIDATLRVVVKEKNTNFDSLIKSLENNPELYRFVYRIIVDGDFVRYNQHESTIEQGVLHGIFKQQEHLAVQNRVFEQVLYNYMIAKTEVALKSHFNHAGHFTLNNGSLDMPAVLLKFQQFMKEEFSEKDKSFLEQNGRLVFLSFLSPILNGKGQALKEVQASEEKRLDVVATYNQFRYIIELKRWYGDVYHQKGIQQLSDYMNIKGEKTGYLVIFEYNKTKSWHKEWIEYEGKRIFAIWV
jgi:energy-coupling factor transporter ATP-binding protein EcfA2